MLTRIFIFLFLLPSISQAQVGMWTWVNGNDTLYANGRYGVQGVPAPLNTPPAVYEPCDWQDQQGNFWVFGGFSSHFNSNMADLWKYNPSTNEWTWMKGIGAISNGVDSGNYGTMRVTSPLNRPAGRGWGTPTWTDNSGNFWMYAGTNSADLWKYSVATNEWTWMQGSTYYNNWWHPIYPHHGTFQVPDSMNTPGNRYEVSTTWTDNNGNLWLFGGESEDSIASQAFYNDMWKYDVSVNQWVWMNGSNFPNDTGYYGTKGVASPLNRPPARSAYAKWKDPEGNFYLMGGLYMGLNGSCTYQGFNDVWKYKIATNNWIWLGGSSTYNQQGTQTAVCETDSTNIPENYSENRAVCFDGCGNVFMFGGIGAASCNTSSDVKNELWHYNTYTNEWTVISPWSGTNFGVKGLTTSFNKPPSTFGSLAWYHDEKIWIFGGSRSGNNESYNCMWRYDLDTSCLPKLCPLPTDLQALQSDNELKLLPNPAMSDLFIQTKLDVEQVNIYDISGSLVSQTKLPQNKSIDVNQLATGLYIAEIKTKETTVRRKWMKM